MIGKTTKCYIYTRVSAAIQVNNFEDLIEVMLNSDLSEFQYVIDDGEWNIVKK